MANENTTLLAIAMALGALFFITIAQAISG